MKRHRRDLTIMSDMNLTNMMDTAFNLLIAFMLVAPMVKHGLNLELPKVDSGQMTTNNETATIIIRKAPLADMNDQIFIDEGERQLTLEELEEQIDIKRSRVENFSVVIEADKGAAYGTFAQVVGLMKNMGIEGIGLVTQPEEEDKDKRR